MQPAPPRSAPVYWWWTRASGLLLRWELRLGTESLGFIYLFPPGYVALWDSETPNRPTGERVSWCLETSLLRLPPPDRSPSLTLLSLSLSFIFCPTSFRRQWAAFLGAWWPLPSFRSCFWVFAQCSNDLSMILWGRKWSPHPIPPPFSMYFGHEFEQAPGVFDGQGNLVCCDHGVTKNWTWLSNWTEASKVEALTLNDSQTRWS